MILAAGIFLLWLSGFLFLFRIPVCRKGNGKKGGEEVSVIIPARNEEARLPGLLESLSLQDPAPGELIVVDDESEDSTAELARAAGARVLPSRPLPPGWRGKTWACRQGAEAARGRVLLFLDADTRLLPGGLNRLLAEFRRTGGALSLLPYHNTLKPYEELSAFFQILMAAGVGAFTVLGRRGRAGLFGQSLMIAREDYRRAGGHGKVRDKILENFFLAEVLRRSGMKVSARGGREVLTVRMYPGGPGELISGWTKAFAAGAVGTAPAILVLTGFWITGGILAAFSPAAAAAGFISLPAAVIAYLLYSLQIFSMLRRLGDYSPLTALLYPVGLSFYLAVFFRSLVVLRRRKEVEWKGRRFAAGAGRGGK